MNDREALGRLQALYSRKDRLHSDAEGLAWLEEVGGLLHRLSPDRATEFDELTPYVLAPLSDQTMGPIWYKVGTIVQGALAEASKRLERIEDGEQALALLRGGREGNREFNRLRMSGGPKLNLEGVDLAGIEFEPLINLRGVILRRANLQGATFRGGQFDHANLYKTNLRGCHLYEAHFTQTHLAAADLSETLLYGAEFVDANMDDVDVTEAVFGYTVIASDISHVQGLETTLHQARSFIAVHTLRRAGPLPEQFLRGCGLSDQDIDYFRGSPAQSEMEAGSCFICYSVDEEELASKLYADLQQRGIRCWKWDIDGRWGRSLWGEIDSAIPEHGRLLLIASQASLRSPAVGREIERALQLEDDRHREGKPADVLFPIRTDDYVFEGWQHERKADVTKKLIGDARKWRKPSHYRGLLERVVRDLAL